MTPGDLDGDRPRRVGRFESAVEALHALGAVASTEAAAWRDRFEAAARESEGYPYPAPDPDARKRVESFVEDLFDKKRRRRWAAEKELHSFRRTLFSLEAVGAIPLEEAYGWIDRFCVEAGLPTRADEEERGRVPWCTALDLRRVIAAPIAVGRLQISRLELYSDGALLYSREMGPDGRTSVRCGGPPANPFPQTKQPSAPEVCDDLGTAYELQPYHGFAKALTPAVPDLASRLEISYAGAGATIALR